MRLHAWNPFTTFALIETFLKEKIYAWLEHHLSDFVFLLDRFKYVFIGFEVWLELFMYMYKISIYLCCLCCEIYHNSSYKRRMKLSN